MGTDTKAAHLTAVAKSYIQWRDRKNRKKRQQREELKEYTLPALAQLGQDIAQARSAGHKIDDVMSVMGLKNKNFMYDALRAYQDANGLADEDVIPDASEAPVPTSVSVTKITDTQVSADIEGDIKFLTVNDRGVIIDMPEAWLKNLDATKKSQVQEVIALTRELF